MDTPPLMELTAVELARFLDKQGHANKAVSILTDLLSRDARSASPKSLSALARLAYANKQWREAGVLWRMLADSPACDCEALAKCAHCLIEQGQSSEAAPFIAKLAARLGMERDRWPAEKSDELLAVLYEQICLHVLGDDLPKAESALQLAARFPSYAAKISGCAETEPSKDLSDQEILRRLDTAAREWEARGSTVPFLAQRCGTLRAEKSAGVAQGKKILLIMRKFFLDRADSREHELSVFFQTSARAVGLEVLFFPSEPLTNPKGAPPERQYAELDRLARLILSARPDAVIFDELCNQNPGGEYSGPEVFRNVLSALKARHPFKLVGFYPDSWMPDCLATIEYVRLFADVIWHLNHYPPRDRNDGGGAKMFWAPIPYPEALFQLGPVGKDIATAFVGGLYRYNFPRGLWLALIKSRGVPCQLFLSRHTAADSKAGASAEEYAAFMSRLRISVNFSARTASRKIMTGRAWESILSKSLLLEEDNAEITRFFVPFVHYIPFGNIEELSAYVSFFQRKEDARRSIAERAFTWFQRCYSKERIWGDLISL
jgi:hypothetical protein